MVLRLHSLEDLRLRQFAHQQVLYVAQQWVFNLFTLFGRFERSVAFVIFLRVSICKELFARWFLYMSNNFFLFLNFLDMNVILCWFSRCYFEGVEFFLNYFELGGAILFFFESFPLIEENIGLLACDGFEAALGDITIVHLDKGGLTLYQRLP